MHIPFCRSRCAYCDFVSCTDMSVQKAYVAAVCAEADERLRGVADSVFLGGGTPSVLERGLLTEMATALRRNARLCADTEFTCEANPDSCTDAFLDEAAKAGVDRISLGVQSLSDTVLSAIGRRHTAEQAVAAVRRVQRHGIQNVSCDLMVGLPAQTERDVTTAVDTLAALGVKHISVYALQCERGTPLYASGYRPDEDASADLYDAAYARLLFHGFSRYEVSNFALPGYACRHNKKYWSLAPYIGLGAAAHSYDGNVRSCNTNDISAYIAGERGVHTETLSLQERAEEYIMLGLRTQEGIYFDRLRSLCGYDWRAQKQADLDALLSSGHLRYTDGGVCLTDSAYYVMNEVIVRLLQ